MGLSFSNARLIASSVALFVLASLFFYFLVFRFISRILSIIFFVAFFCLFFDIFRLKFVDFVFVIFLLAPLSAPSRDFVSYSLVVTCNYVINLFYSKFYSY